MSEATSVLTVIQIVQGTVRVVSFILTIFKHASILVGYTFSGAGVGQAEVATIGLSALGDRTLSTCAVRILSTEVVLRKN